MRRKRPALRVFLEVLDEQAVLRFWLWSDGAHQLLKARQILAISTPIEPRNGAFFNIFRKQILL